MKKISLTGPESAGKSTLAAQLAAHYGSVFVPEYAREYLEKNGARYALPDLEAIAHGQLAAEDVAAAHATGLLFCDTDLLVLKIWAENAFGACPAWILAALARPRYALTLLLAPTCPGRPTRCASTPTRPSAGTFTGCTWPSCKAGAGPLPKSVGHPPSAWRRPPRP
ncbi:AAA family ATPase [Hymenobacter sp. BRD67]|uniref:AAA family ATPase n=1 Tax=Hymenobacter sp. BRD67 TaxID=2675877 RepID=UPI0020B8071D|nr:ATP-binding protein [Hymenobacter sp. BRD67]